MHSSINGKSNFHSTSRIQYVLNQIIKYLFSLLLHSCGGSFFLSLILQSSRMYTSQVSGRVKCILSKEIGFMLALISIPLQNPVKYMANTLKQLLKSDNYLTRQERLIKKFYLMSRVQFHLSIGNKGD